jgi:hypothetical protein
MKPQPVCLLIVCLLNLCACRLVWAQDVDPKLQQEIDAKVKDIRTWVCADVIVEAVKAQNANPPPQAREMTQEKWASLRITDPVVRAYTRNAAGQFLRTKKDDVISEGFISDACGYKVAFLAKTTWFCHRGKPKHDVPMKGESWQGPIEVDESSGVRQVQVGLPILDGGKPIGSLVVGLCVSKMGKGE